LRIELNPNLEEIGEHFRLAQIGEDLRIWGNQNLKSLAGFTALGSIGGVVLIVDQQRLDNAQARRFVQYSQKKNRAVIWANKTLPSLDISCQVQTVEVGETTEKKPKKSRLLATPTHIISCADGTY